MAFKMTGFSPFNKGIAKDLTMEEEFKKEKEEKEKKDFRDNPPDPDREDGGYGSAYTYSDMIAKNPKNTPYEEKTGGGSYAKD